MLFLTDDERVLRVVEVVVRLSENEAYLLEGDFE